jgi:penicillin amidase
MRIVPFLVSTTVTVGLIVILNIQLPAGSGKTPRLGNFLSPQKGFWQNAEPADISFDKNIAIPGLASTTDVYFDERLVPHVYAANETDAYFVQGYLHAKFRLWQMEFQTYIAAGRLSEVIGEDGLKIDRYFRRLGMVYGAEQSLHSMEADPVIRPIMNAYTAGVNAYIHSLQSKDLPLEYKLLDYKPEAWTNMKSALFLKFMSFDLSGQGDDDLFMTNTRNLLGYETFKKLFPLRDDSLDPIIPKGTAFEKPGIEVKVPAHLDSVYFGIKDVVTAIPPIIPPKNNGSNNWAVSGSKTKSGKPILCNDPHLGLNLPSLWYEMQISTPSHNSYGVSFPGAPTIIIGFNDSIAWGVTNAGRDVKDFYEIRFKDNSMREYWLDSGWHKSGFRKEVIKVKGLPDVIENIAMTLFGPVMYDQSYKSKNEDGKYYAVRWTAHDASDELLTFYKLNKANNYKDYVDAVSTFQCPGQNFVFASVSGDIAIRQEGKFVAKWKQQGDFVQPGTNSNYNWQGFIPENENPRLLNPARGFVSSANQMSVDSTYPYYLGRAGNFTSTRGYIINRKLEAMSSITPRDMEQLQTDNYNVTAEFARPVLLKLLDESKLNTNEKRILSIFKGWNLRNDVTEKGATIFKVFWDSVYMQTYQDEFGKSKIPLFWPTHTTLLESLLKDSAYAFADDINTKDKRETMNEVVLIAYKKACLTVVKAEKENSAEWGKFKDTRINHLLKIPALSRLHLPIGGGTGVINATTDNHGPSWRMVVHLTTPVEAYVVYPGGQSGNPGSKYYDSFIDTWAAGKYYPVLFLRKQDIIHALQIKWHLTFVKA